MAITYNTRTVIQEIRSALAWPDSDQVITDEVLYEKMIYWMDQSSTFTFTQLTSNYYSCSLGTQYMIHGLSFTGEDGCTYQVNPNGTIRVTAGTATAETISATGCLVQFNNVMVDVFKWLATHRSIEAGVNIPMGTYTPRTAQEILDMADAWMGVTNG